ncbi:ABC transporter ATP-binding protein [Mucilaginibacter ginsenosidivorans]|uniref:ABC transporter ATP-binding protein n=1 Tax=Mucilaginibacter ginsenosidivorans TaxID=398053 RepID=A0A5B8UZS9_9SPHI|nr:ABC transporter ATP-binding protein [Mucilaginibacter ginsenosidivorans]QEC63796.1 ABC transporter ATP-binding protein [Mucilaginibacter ginsenosidivorans]
MNYDLNKLSTEQEKASTLGALKKLLDFISHEKKNLWLAFLAILVNASVNLFGPLLIGHAIDKYVIPGNYHGVLVISGVLLAMYICGLVASYLQTILMGGVGQRMLYTLRNAIFNKLQQLPVAFFNQNKAGDLISRVNNDTDKINTFFSQSLMQFVSNLAIMVGAGIFLLSINPELGAATIAPAALAWIFTKILSPWVKRKNAVNLKSVGGMSAEIQESLNNFKVIIAFNRRDYFRKRFDEANKENYTTSIRAGIANNIFLPVYTLLAGVAQLIVLAFGIYLISKGQFSVGLLVSYLSYVNSFYNPLRQLATLWATFQTAMAGWDRISNILSLETNLVTVGSGAVEGSDALLEFRNVHFAYPGGNEILHNISFKMQRGKTYALVGPTGGGKTTTASLIARLYDPTEGTIFLDGKDIRSYEPDERTRKIGFILQEPFLFTGTVRDNILYSNEAYQNLSNDQIEQELKKASLQGLLDIFDQGLDTPVLSSGDSTSLGQKQLIAFMRAVLRNPDILILDEATANIDTITEKLLSDILENLPESTTRVIIAHRLNTIENADEIYFVNSGEVIAAGSLDHAIDMLLQGKRVS